MVLLCPWMATAEGLSFFPSVIDLTPKCVTSWWEMLLGTAINFMQFNTPITLQFQDHWTQGQPGNEKRS